MSGWHWSTKYLYKVAVITQHHSHITNGYHTYVAAVEISCSYLCRDGYVGMVVCYHCHLVCVLFRPVPYILFV